MEPSGLLTCDRHLSAPHEVALVPHQDDRCVLSGTGATQGDSQLGGSQEGRSVGDGVQQQVGIASLHVALLSPVSVSLKNMQFETRLRTQTECS